MHLVKHLHLITFFFFSSSFFFILRFLYISSWVNTFYVLEKTCPFFFFSRTHDNNHSAFLSLRLYIRFLSSLHHQQKPKKKSHFFMIQSFLAHTKYFINVIIYILYILCIFLYIVLLSSSSSSPLSIYYYSYEYDYYTRRSILVYISISIYIFIFFDVKDDDQVQHHLGENGPFRVVSTPRLKLFPIPPPTPVCFFEFKKQRIRIRVSFLNATK